MALNHTAGLSTPQQVQMALFSLYALMYQPNAYKAAVKRLVRGRKAALYQAIGIECESDENDVAYYNILDAEVVGRKTYGEA
ncbi:bifunctional aspartate transaminase/aspartate 4-decarboxylase, partial [Escherichia coli]